MGIDLNLYRQRVGKLYLALHTNGAYLIDLNTYILTFMLFSFGIIGIRIVLLLLCCGDVHPNPGPENNLKIAHLNVCSLRDKIDIVKAELNNFDVICISETWLRKDDVGNVVIPGYHTPVRKDRMTRGGGVAIYVKECLFHKHIYVRLGSKWSGELKIKIYLLGASIDLIIVMLTGN